MLKSSLRNYNDVYILHKGTITIAKTAAVDNPDNRTKKVIFKNCAPFADCKSYKQQAST